LIEHAIQPSFALGHALANWNAISAALRERSRARPAQFQAYKEMHQLS
jgi:hypothetical protein